MRNVELKAVRKNLAADRARCRKLGAEFAGRLTQRDTYFKVERGRLKLREQRPGEAQLIAYLRPDESRARICDYRLVSAPQPAALRAALASCLGVVAEVRKIRELYLYRGVRIHLDRVRGLGSFIEFEAVVTPGRTARWGRRMIRELSEAFEIDADDTVPDSYVDLVRSRNEGK